MLFYSFWLPAELETRACVLPNTYGTWRCNIFPERNHAHPQEAIGRCASPQLLMCLCTSSISMLASAFERSSRAKMIETGVAAAMFRPRLVAFGHEDL